jgi:hypothetical protein
VDCIKIFLDCGTHLGDGLKSHVQLLGIDESWQIYSFEANPYTFDYLQKILENKKYDRDSYYFFEYPFLSLQNKAVWVRDEKIQFFCSKTNYSENIEVKNYFLEHSLKVNRGDYIASHLDSGLPIDGSSTAFMKHHSRALSKLGNSVQKSITWESQVTVNAIDFASFILALPQEAEIYCKLDIEGSEFKVLLHLLRQRAFKKIKYLSVEWHYYDSFKLRSLKAAITLLYRMLGIRIQGWC